MKTRLAIVLAAVMVVVMASAFAADTKAPSSSAKAPSKAAPAAPRAERPGIEAGRMAVAAKTETATISSIDPATRMVSLKMPDGQVKSFKVGEHVKNLDQFKVGDSVKATLIDAMGVSLRRAGEQPSAKETREITLAPEGAKQNAIVSKTQELTGKVQSVDPATGMVAIQGPGGQVHDIKAGPRMNLSQVKPGDNITLRHTEAMALDLEKATG